MAKTTYHISPDTGRPNICRAQTSNGCLYAKDGEIPPHFDSKEEARSAYEKEQQKDNTHLMPTVQKKIGRPRKNPLPEISTTETFNKNAENISHDIDPYLNTDNDEDSMFEEIDGTDFSDVDPDITDLEDLENGLNIDENDDSDDDEIVAENDGNVCDNCGESGNDVKLRIDPYEKETHDRTVWRPLCDDCYESLKYNDF